MQESIKQAAPQKEKLHVKAVTVFIQSNLYLLKGDWEWNLNSEAVFCSDVILSLPTSFEGTTAIIHPDDLSFVKEIIGSKQEKIDHLKFRILTTYGEVKPLSGDAIVIEKIENEEDRQQLEIFQQVTKQLAVQKEFENLQLQKEIYERTEKFIGTGIWYYNSATNETWYSSQVFRIYNLPPQSLNAHLNTFNSFIHPEDKEQVIEFTARAFKQRNPLHMQFRVVTTGGEKIVLSATHWFFNTKGEQILSGTLQDITEQKKLEESIDTSAHSIGFMKQRLAMDEQYSNIGHWQVHLLTRKTAYSDNYYRIFGLKAQSLPAGVRSFINYVDPEYRDLFAAAHKKMIYEHVPPEIDFRITRTDGKVRYISQKAKLVTYGNEMVVVGIIQDVTVQKLLEKRLAEVTGKEAIRNFTSRGMEEMAGIASWVWELNTGEISWSENFYKFLGYKINSVELSQKLLLAFIHPEDQKLFKNNQSLVLEQKQETEFEFRLLNRGIIRHIKAAFRLLQDKETNVFIATLQDVTKETVLQKELKQRIQFVEALSENIQDRIIITDTNNNVLSWNRECEKVYGVKKDTAVGSNFFDVFPQLKTQDELQLFNRVLKGEKINVQSNKSHLGKGYYNLSMMPLWDEEGIEVTGIIHIIHDVTKEYQLRQNLNERLNFISGILESSVDRIIALDHNMNYLYWNKKAEEYYNLKAEEVVGKNILEIFPSVVNDPSYGEFRRVIKGEVVHIPASENLKKQKEYYETYLIPIKDEKEQVSGVLWIAHDLTREYELKLLHTKEREVLEALNENYFELDSDYRVSYVNQNGADFFNAKKEDIVGKTIWELNPNVIDTPFFIAVKKAMEEGVSTRTELKSPTRGTWMNVSIAPTADGVIILSFDIENIKAVQENLEQSKEILEAVFNASLHGLILLKAVRDDKNEILDFEIVMNNRVTKKWNGRDLVGERYAESFPAIKKNGIFEGFKKVIESGEPLTLEVHYDDDGLDNWFCIAAVKLGDGLAATAEDITKRKKAEQELSQTYFSVALQNKIYEHAEDIASLGTWTWNMDTNEAKYSDNMFRLFGMQPGEVEPNFETIPKFIHPEDRGKLLDKAALLKEGSEPIGVEYRVIRKDGVERVFCNRVKLCRNEVGQRLVIGTTQDVTEEIDLRKKLTEALQ